MAEDLSKSPVPVRLAYRYPNGSMVSYSARAISRKGDGVTVIVNEYFDEGITVAMHADFLEGLTNFRVISVARSIKKPGYFETLLRPAESVPVGDGKGLVAESEVVPDDVPGAARALADRLEIDPPMRFSEALRGLTADVRPMALVVGVAAVVHCLESREMVQPGSLLTRARKAAKFPVAKQRPAEAARKAG
jgi:hypothetical protein